MELGDSTTPRYQFGMGLRELRELAGLSQQALADKANTSQPQIDRLEKGQRKLTREWAERLAPHLRVTPQSLLFGGEPEFSRVPAGEEFPKDPEFDPDAGRSVAYQFDYDGETRGASPEIDARAGAGQGQMGQEHVVTLDSGGVVTGHRVVGEWTLPPDMVRHEMQANPARTWVVAVVGDSMSPTLKNGDRVFVDTMHTRLSPDGLYVIDEGDGPMVKRLHRIRDSDPPAAEIISDNEHHPRFARTLDRFRIIGRVCGRFEVM